MAKTVQLSEEAYGSLRLLKRQGESFSDVVNRIVRSLKDPGKLRELSTPIEGFDWDEVDRRMQEADRAKARSRFAEDAPQHLDHEKSG